MSLKIRALQAKKAEHVKAARALTDAAESENRDLTAEEQATFDAHAESIRQVNAAIDRESLLASEEAGVVPTAGGNSVQIPAAASISVSDRRENDPRRGFTSFGEFSAAVGRAGIGAGLDQRLRIGAAALPSGQFNNESSGQDGGFAIPPEFSNEIWQMSLGEGSLLPMTDNTELTGNSMIFPKDETTPWGGDGVQAYWQSEASQAQASKLVLGSSTMVLHKLMVLVPVTNELMDDGFAIGSYLSPKVSERIQWKTNEAILFGDGVGKPMGALNSKALVVQAKEAGQAAASIVPQNLSKMVSQLMVGQLGNAIWLGNPDVIPALEAMTLGNYPIYLPNNNVAGNSYGTLKGRPLILSEHASALGAQADLSLLSLKGYRTVTKAGGLQTATSMHLYFDADAVAFRTTFRLNGAPILSQPVTPPKSTNKRSYFVTLAARG